MYGIFTLFDICKGTLLINKENVPVNGGEWAVLVTVKLVGDDPATKPVPIEVGRGVTGRYRLRIMQYSQPAGDPFVGFPLASSNVTFTVG